ncbi:hypothetical protein HYFRA_00011533 [Hymenoscyphus fraxineus]|uniref:DUF676 domain-containing protein n=1 Tax=Hymenoscyphus fraxineus TaxID=746836 RepID=A0A9N9L2H4_9HELO|nr:hypothetical protein HYFRA_00011533 [Hymenoscyphus fraxineus]
MGTQLLYSAEDVASIVADIVFVHGLRGDPIATWSDGKVCWPRDFLRDDVPNTRIMTWGYDSNIASVTEFSSANSIFGHAENLLFDVARRRRTPSEKTRPIIFVGHSLGGLVIKEALIRSSEYLNNQQDMALGSIFKYTSGVIFLGTPHRGSEKTGLGQIVATIAAVALRQPNDKLLKNLEKESDVLERQRRSFASISKNLPVVCLWEEKPMAIGISRGTVFSVTEFRATNTTTYPLNPANQTLGMLGDMFAEKPELYVLYISISHISVYLEYFKYNEKGARVSN